MVRWLKLSIFLMLFAAVPLAYAVWFHDTSVSKFSGDWGTFGDYVGGLLNPMIALSVFYWVTKELKFSYEKGLLDKMTLTLTRAHGAIKGETAKPDYVAWLTAARHLQRYKKLKKYLTSKIIKILCEEEEEYWRHQFYLLVEELMMDNAFAHLDRTSLAVVLAFGDWSEKVIDPLSEIDLEKFIATHKLDGGGFNTSVRLFFNKPREQKDYVQ